MRHGYVMYAISRRRFRFLLGRALFLLSSIMLFLLNVYTPTVKKKILHVYLVPVVISLICRRYFKRMYI